MPVTGVRILQQVSLKHLIKLCSALVTHYPILVDTKGEPFALGDIFNSFTLVFSSWIGQPRTSSDRKLLKTGRILQ